MIVPIGSVEQHGPHLPLTTDIDIASALSTSLLSRLRSAEHADGSTGPFLLAPPMPYGASGEHAGFPGTVSIGTEALAQVLIEIGRSTLQWADRLCLINGHGGNIDALGIAVRALRAEDRDAAWAPCGAARVSGDLHAGRTETSLMLALAPEVVHEDLAEPGDTRTAHELLPELRARGVRAVSPNGVLGNPRGARASEGHELFARILAEMRDRVLAWRPHERTGMLALADHGPNRIA